MFLEDFAASHTAKTNYCAYSVYPQIAWIINPCCVSLYDPAVYNQDTLLSFTRTAGGLVTCVKNVKCQVSKSVFF